MKWVLGKLATCACLAAVVMAAVLVVPALLGYERYVITSDSMTGAYDRGSVVFADVVPVSELRNGDTVTFTPPNAKELVTHRIQSIRPGADGRPALRTKGDANAFVDPWTFAPATDELPRASTAVPELGHVVSALNDDAVRLLGITLPALLLALVLLRSLWRDVRAERRVEVAA